MNPSEIQTEPLTSGEERLNRILGDETENRIFGSDYDDWIAGRRSDDKIWGGLGDDTLRGGQGDDFLSGEAGADLLRGGRGEDELHGGDGDDELRGGADDDRLYAGDGNDILRGGKGDDTLYGGAGDDLMFGGTGNDHLSAGDGNDILRGGQGNDRLMGFDGDDLLFGGAGADRMIGGDGDDIQRGGAGNDVIYDGYGSDQLFGGAGDDVLYSQSDAGEPIIAQDPDAPLATGAQPTSTLDLLKGGDGADRFYFDLRMDAKAEIIAKHTDANGTIDWESIMAENDSFHDHWVQSIGEDHILDFSREEGDSIEIHGHTVAVDLDYAQVNGRDASILTLFSDQAGAMGGMDMGGMMMDGAPMAHDGDSLGRIVVFGDRVEMMDLIIESAGWSGVGDILVEF